MTHRRLYLGDISPGRNPGRDPSVAEVVLDELLGEPGAGNGIIERGSQRFDAVSSAVVTSCHHMMKNPLTSLSIILYLPVCPHMFR